MIKIVFVPPYEEMMDEINDAFAQLARTDVEYKFLDIARTEEELAIQLEKSKEMHADVIVARGLASLYYDSHRPKGMFNVEISTTGLDLVMAVNRCIKTHGVNHLSIVGTESMIYGSQNFDDVFDGITIERHCMDSQDCLAEKMALATANGAQAVVGGYTVCRLATKQGLANTTILTGRESILKAVELATRLVEATRKEREDRERITKIMEFSYGGILSIDSNGIMQSINQKACSMFAITTQEALGKPVSILLPNINIARLFRRNETLIDEICRINGRIITFNFVPIESTSSVKEAVITCHEAEELRKTEAKIRKNILQKGFTAKYTLEDIIHCDPSMKRTLQTARQFACNESNVLLYGETGVGKEMFAQGIHNISRRANGPFVALNCAALPEQLLESELFGYVEGAFTGASKHGKMGMFEAAHRGTIFLDEIGDLSPTLQGRILRVIQEKEIVRLGDNHVIPIDVRVISATNKDLLQEVKNGTFRSDLMYRLDVLKITIPTLKQRKEDILPLCWHFITEICLQEQKPPMTSIEPMAQKLLEEYHWAGNVRQLRNVSQRICVLSTQSIITTDVVLAALDMPCALPVAQPTQEVATTPWTQEQERVQVMTALQNADYNRGAAAEALGIDRSTLWRKMKKYNLLS